jgi:hypothetical protein
MLIKIEEPSSNVCSSPATLSTVSTHSVCVILSPPFSVCPTTIITLPLLRFALQPPALGLFPSVYYTYRLTKLLCIRQIWSRACFMYHAPWKRHLVSQSCCRNQCTSCSIAVYVYGISIPSWGVSQSQATQRSESLPGEIILIRHMHWLKAGSTKTRTDEPGSSLQQESGGEIERRFVAQILTSLQTLAT